MMSPSRMPYQCMVQCGNLLIAARGSSIDIFQDGLLLSTWKPPSSQGMGTAPSPSEISTRLATQNSESSSVEITLESSSPPAKKRKLSASESGDVNSISKEGRKKRLNRSDVVDSGLEAPAFAALAATRKGNHVIAVTGEDKSIRVFEIVREDGMHLKQLSQR